VSAASVVAGGGRGVPSLTNSRRRLANISRDQFGV
jgi:hypothetical protein